MTTTSGRRFVPPQGVIDAPQGAVNPPGASRPPADAGTPPQGGAALVIAAVVIVLAGLLSAVEAKMGAKPKTVWKSRSAKIAAAHALHVGKQGMECTACHAKAPASKSAADLLVPTNKACLPCHEKAVCKGAFAGTCKACHTAKPASLAALKAKHAQKAEVIFPHAAHLAGGAGQEQCLSCHPLDTKSSSGSKTKNPPLPGMQSCIECHAADYEAAACTTCHLKTKTGTMKKTVAPGVSFLPPAWMEGMKHDAFWYKQHAPAAAGKASLCAACHTDDDCDRCHAPAGQARPAALHPGDWMLDHSVASMAGDLKCSSCHSLQNFCLPCHRRSGVAWDSPSGLGVPAGSLFHPQGWYGAGGGAAAPSLHAKEAKKTIASCVSCHTENDCMMCHANPLTGSNPHPPSPQWHKKCKTLYAKNPGVCLKCHTLILDVCK